MLHGVRHLLSPGTPTYAALKVGAVAGFVGLQFAVRRRAADRRGPAEHGSDGGEGKSSPAPQRTHPRSKKKRRRRR
jgi:hypothetical protein